MRTWPRRLGFILIPGAFLAIGSEHGWPGASTLALAPGARQVCRPDCAGTPPMALTIYDMAEVPRATYIPTAINASVEPGQNGTRNSNGHRCRTDSPERTVLRDWRSRLAMRR